MKNRAPASFAMRIDELGDRRIEPRLPQGFDHETALPGPVMRLVPVLHGAAAAHAEMRTDRRNTRRAFALDVQKSTPVGMAWGLFDLDGFARQRARHVNRAVRAFGNAVAAMADANDGKPFNHAPPR